MMNHHHPMKKKYTNDELVVVDVLETLHIKLTHYKDFKMDDDDGCEVEILYPDHMRESEMVCQMAKSGIINQGRHFINYCAEFLQETYTQKDRILYEIIKFANIIDHFVDNCVCIPVITPEIYRLLNRYHTIMNEFVCRPQSIKSTLHFLRKNMYCGNESIETSQAIFQSLASCVCTVCSVCSSNGNLNKKYRELHWYSQDIKQMLHNVFDMVHLATTFDKLFSRPLLNKLMYITEIWINNILHCDNNNAANNNNTNKGEDCCCWKIMIKYHQPSAFEEVYFYLAAALLSFYDNEEHETFEFLSTAFILTYIDGLMMKQQSHASYSTHLHRHEYFAYCAWIKEKIELEWMIKESQMNQYFSGNQWLHQLLNSFPNLQQQQLPWFNDKDGSRMWDEFMEDHNLDNLFWLEYAITYFGGAQEQQQQQDHNPYIKNEIIFLYAKSLIFKKKYDDVSQQRANNFFKVGYDLMHLLRFDNYDYRKEKERLMSSSLLSNETHIILHDQAICKLFLERYEYCDEYVRSQASLFHNEYFIDDKQFAITYQQLLNMGLFTLAHSHKLRDLKEFCVNLNDGKLMENFDVKTFILLMKDRFKWHQNIFIDDNDAPYSCFNAFTTPPFHKQIIHHPMFCSIVLKNAYCKLMKAKFELRFTTKPITNDALLNFLSEIDGILSIFEDVEQAYNKKILRPAKMVVKIENLWLCSIAIKELYDVFISRKFYTVVMKSLLTTAPNDKGTTTTTTTTLSANDDYPTSFKTSLIRRYFIHHPALAGLHFSNENDEETGHNPIFALLRHNAKLFTKVQSLISKNCTTTELATLHLMELLYFLYVAAIQCSNSSPSFYSPDKKEMNQFIQDMKSRWESLRNDYERGCNE